MAAYEPGLYGLFAEFLLDFPGILLLMAWSFFLSFHLCTGIRHLIWDTGRGLTLPAVHFGNWLVLLVALLMTAILWGGLLL